VHVSQPSSGTDLHVLPLRRAPLANITMGRIAVRHATVTSQTATRQQKAHLVHVIMCMGTQAQITVRADSSSTSGRTATATMGRRVGAVCTEMAMVRAFSARRTKHCRVRATASAHQTLILLGLSACRVLMGAPLARISFNAPRVSLLTL